MQNVSIKGFIYAALSSATFGLAPFFTISLLLAGFSSFEVLAYRWGIASLTLVVFGIMLGETFRISRKDWGTVFILSLLRAATSFSLVIAYQNIASGVASTIHFMYPLAVALAMMGFFGEKRSFAILFAVLVSLSGAGLLSSGKLTCYVMGLGALFFIIGGCLTGGIRLANDTHTWLNILGLALPATAISNITLVKAIKYIGPTLTSIFGALEPLTAVVIGCLIFNESFTPASAVGMALIITAVTVVVVHEKKKESQS